MKLEKLNKNQVEKIYRESMEVDFPADELKPLEVLFSAMDSEIYECFGLFSDGDIVGYTFLERLGNDYLIDYLAIYPQVRNQGYGGELIRLLGEYLTDATSILGEVEDPEFAKNENDRKLQARRLNFYLRNGFRNTKIKASAFGVPFIIIEMGEGLNHSYEEVKVLYKKMYKTILPAELYEKNIVI